MPVYNGGEALRRAIENILAQTERNLEIILSDNSSTDGVTQSICEEFARRDPRIRLTRHETNRGAIANFLWVVDQAQGKYFMWAAHDDTWSNNYVELLTRRLEENPDAVLATSQTTCDRKTKNGAREKHCLPAAPDSDRWKTLDVFIKDAGCEWIYGIYRTDWLKAATPQWVNYPLEFGDLVWMFDLLVRERVVGEPHAMFYYTNSHKLQKKAAGHRVRRIELWTKLIYHLVRISWTRVPRSERLRALSAASRLIYRYHLYRRGPLGTSMNIAKLAVLWSWFGLGKGLSRLTGERVRA
jgi:glycosyltransferase involved in cell wall biosynthesis